MLFQLNSLENIELLTNPALVIPVLLDIPSNFTSRENNTSKCSCQQQEDMLHIYECKYLNSENQEVNYELIYHGNIEEQKSVLRRFEYNLEIRTEYLNMESEKEEHESDHAIHSSDPLYSELLEYGNG